MSGKELGFPKTRDCSLQEAASRAVLREVRRLGYCGIELRESGKRVIFFCTFCLATCYTENSLFDHLKGNLHSKRYALAQHTLLQSNPWPFNDGILFFSEWCSKKQELTIPIMHNETFNIENKKLKLTLSKQDECSKVIVLKEFDSYSMVVPGVLSEDEISQLGIRPIGFGDVGLRIKEDTGSISKIWCVWLGTEDFSKQKLICDYGIMVFSYSDNLGREEIVDDPDPMLALNSWSESENSENHGSKKGRIDDACHSSVKETSVFSDGELYNKQICQASDAFTVTQCNDLLKCSRSISRKAQRRELRKKKLLLAERTCGICKLQMLPGRDVATLLNKKSGYFACSSRNTSGAFHLFHVSCLTHWLLLCESEIIAGQSCGVKPSPKRGRGKRKAKGNESLSSQISCVFCPECQGTGLEIQEGKLEAPRFPLHQMFLWLLKTVESHKAYMALPEPLQGCSTGLCFKKDSTEDGQESVIPQKLLCFYRADEESL
ncbi:hypothetical protein AMTRI_Chr07g81960 [Amborella trichopoda]